MDKNFLNLLACPHGCGSLSLKRGCLYCVKKHRFPIINGIPRFVSDEKYTKSFGEEWSIWPKVQFKTPETRSHFKIYTGFERKNIKSKLIVEFGCGPGRYLNEVQELGGIAVGLEMSSAVDQAAKNLKNNPNVFLVQGDILHPPFKKNVFDHGFSIGVLHHTPDPRKGLSNLAQVVKKGGKVIVSVYSKNSPYNYPSLKLARWIYNKTKSFAFAYNYAKLSADSLYPIVSRTGRTLSYLIAKYLVVVIFVKSRDWRLLDNFDAITPKIATTHTGSEVVGWFKEAGIKNLIKTRNETSFIGVK